MNRAGSLTASHGHYTKENYWTKFSKLRYLNYTYLTTTADMVGPTTEHDRSPKRARLGYHG